LQSLFFTGIFLQLHFNSIKAFSLPSEIRYASRLLVFDNTRAREELGLDFRPVEDSLRESLRWFRENGYV
jgi:dihydroflavonol-4-reductase